MTGVPLLAGEVMLNWSARQSPVPPPVNLQRGCMFGRLGIELYV